MRQRTSLRAKEALTRIKQEIHDMGVEGTGEDFVLAQKLLMDVLAREEEETHAGARRS